MADGRIDARWGAPSRRAFLKGAAAALAAGVLISATGCSGARREEDEAGKRIFHWGQARPDAVLDAQRSSDPAVACVVGAVCEGLYALDGDMKLSCALAAEDPAWSDDGLTLTVKLKEGVAFHNGDPFTSDDVVHTFTRMFKPETCGVNTGLFECIEGASAVMDGSADELAGVVAVDDHTVEFHLRSRFAQFAYCLATPYACIYPREACEDAGSDWGTGAVLVGTGPYEMVSADGAKVVLEANDSWHAGEPAFDGVEVSYFDDPSAKLDAFGSGALDACDVPASLLSRVEQDEGLAPRLAFYDAMGVCYVVLNLGDEALADKRVRRALSLSLDRTALVDSAVPGAGEPCACLLAPGIPGSRGDDASPLPFDLARAKSLMEEAGVESLSLSVLASGGFSADVMGAVAKMWEELGVRARVLQVDADAFADDRAAGEVQCYLQTWFPLYPDGEDVLSPFYSSESKARSSSYVSDEFDDLVGRARRTLGADARAKLYRQADDLLVREDFACIPLFWPARAYLAAEGVALSAAGNVYRIGAAGAV